MKRLLITATALSMLIGPAAGFAQDHHDDHHDGGGRPGGGGAPHSAPAPQAPRGPQGGYHPQGQAQPQQAPGGQGGYRPQGQPFPGGQGGYRPQAQQFPGGQGGYRPQPGQNGYRPQAGQPNGQGGYRPQGGQFQHSRTGGQAFSYGGRSFMRYRAEPYRYPAQYGGWYNHSWRRGEWLPSAFISPYYFIDDFYDYDLWQPDYGFQWIRVGGDAVLVNLASGQVVDVVPGIYY